jgi:hypothetical protein
MAEYLKKKIIFSEFSFLQTIVVVVVAGLFPNKLEPNVDVAVVVLAPNKPCVFVVAIDIYI